MGEEYEIHLSHRHGEWSGTVQGPEGERSFQGIWELMEQLKMDPVSQMVQLRQQARTDPLTGLLNRRGVEEEVEKALKAGKKQMALLMLDIDNLKQINDTWGHLKGDAVLRKVAQVLRQTGGPDSVVGRIGGDEFVLVLWDIPSEERLRRIGELICRTVACLESEADLSVSIGACQQGKTYGDLMERADLALYRVKRNGKRGVALERTQPGERTNK